MFVTGLFYLFSPERPQVTATFLFQKPKEKKLSTCDMSPLNPAHLYLNATFTLLLYFIRVDAKNRILVMKSFLLIML